MQRLSHASRSAAGGDARRVARDAARLARHPASVAFGRPMHRTRCAPVSRATRQGRRATSRGVAPDGVRLDRECPMHRVRAVRCRVQARVSRAPPGRRRGAVGSSCSDPDGPMPPRGPSSAPSREAWAPRIDAPGLRRWQRVRAPGRRAQPARGGLSRSRISRSSFTSSGGSAGFCSAFSSSWLRTRLYRRSTMKITKAMMRKSITVCSTWP